MNWIVPSEKNIATDTLEKRHEPDGRLVRNTNES